MADNYLEKKMEEHRSGRSSSYRPAVTPRGSRPGELTFSFTPCAIHFAAEVATPPDDATLGLLRELAGCGFRVSFRCADIPAGRSLATTLGCALLPPGMEPDSEAIILALSPEGDVILSRGELQARIGIPAGDPLRLKSVTFAAAMIANLNHSRQSMLRNIKISAHS